MRKIALVIISILFLSGLAYGQEAPKDGIFKEYYESGEILKETMYKDYQKNGLEKHYFKNGRLMHDEWYENGRLKYTIKYDEKGVLKEGLEKLYYENGKIMEESMYKNGKLEGLGKDYFYESDQIQSEKMYKNGEQIDGKYFYEDGGIFSSSTYKDGKKLNIKYYDEAGKEFFILNNRLNRIVNENRQHNKTTQKAEGNALVQASNATP